jgi:predicted dehydrogenase
LDNGPHAFDLARALFGEIASVQATIARHQPIEVEDTAQIRCELAGGGELTMDLSWSLPVPARHYLEIYGSQGAALLDFEGVSYRLQTWQEWKRVTNTVSVRDAFARQIDHFVNAIAGHAPQTTLPIDGLHAQRLIAAAYRSAETGGPIAVVEESSHVGSQVEPAGRMAAV